MNQTKSIEIWNRAKEIIPGGTQLLSKRPEIYSATWPIYYSKAKGVNVWDVNGKIFTDMSSMGIGTCILGYADDFVNNRVKEAIDAGSMSTLNCTEEIDLAELLLDIHPWAGMVRYTRTGGEAMAVAVRIARAASKREKLSVCGYHGWNDFYLSANLADRSNLNNHLLPYLEPSGVPKQLIGTCIPFSYNRIKELEDIITKEDIGVIIIEPARYDKPVDNFLQKVRKIADESNAVLIFDEITSGFRSGIGGIHLEYDVIPDIVVYGKSISNGYPMSAIVGKQEVMQAAKDSFISSTYWSERIGPTAAIATIEKMRHSNYRYNIKSLNDYFVKGFKSIIENSKLNITIKNAIPSLISVEYNYSEKDSIREFIIHEMLKRNYLTSNIIFLSNAHSNKIIDEYLSELEIVLNLVKRKGYKFLQ